MKYLIFSLIAMFTFTASASDVTKVDLKKKKSVSYHRLNINQDRTVVLKGPVRMQNVAAIMDDMKDMAEMSSENIFLIINSPGGSVIDGFELINLIKTLKATKGIRTYCAIESEAYSMAALIAIYCHRTFAHKYSAIMFHEAAYGVSGLAPFITNQVEFMNKYLKELDMDVANQMGIPFDVYKSKTLTEWWMTAKEAAEFGVVDGVLNHLYYITPPPPEQNFFPIFGNEDINTVDNPLKHGKTDMKENEYGN